LKKYLKKYFKEKREKLKYYLKNLKIGDITIESKIIFINNSKLEKIQKDY